MSLRSEKSVGKNEVLWELVGGDLRPSRGNGFFLSGATIGARIMMFGPGYSPIGDNAACLLDVVG